MGLLRCITLFKLISDFILYQVMQWILRKKVRLTSFKIWRYCRVKEVAWCETLMLMQRVLFCLVKVIGAHLHAQLSFVEKTLHFVVHIVNCVENYLLYAMRQHPGPSMSFLLYSYLQETICALNYPILETFYMMTSFWCDLIWGTTKFWSREICIET